MSAGSRHSGFANVGPLQWGTHLCHFYESRDELLSVTGEFLHAGLSNREAAIWVAPVVLGVDKAQHMLVRSAPALRDYLASGQLQILDGAQTYSNPDKPFDSGATVGLWSRAIDDALGRGFDGLRVVGDAVCDSSTDWTALIDYEASVKERLAYRPVIGLCTYCVAQLRAEQTRDVERVHDAVLTPRAVRSSRAEKHSPVACNVNANAHSNAEANDDGMATQRALTPLIGHEMRNAITPLSLVARLLTTQYADDPQLQRYALLLSRQTALLAQLAERLIAPDHTPTHESDAPPSSLASRAETTAKRRCASVALNELIAHCIDVAHANVPMHAPIRFNASDESLNLQGDFSQLTQVFVNLLVNALKYSSMDGTVEIHATRAGRHCYITVRDDGVGISVEDLPSIFKPYSRGQAGRSCKKGLGIGLSVVRDIVLAHGGTVDAFSDTSRAGAEFIVRLPLMRGSDSVAAPIHAHTSQVA
ncbi:MEDS domain-containing protein [Paraburkholderia sp.]|uniref:MEDS domain-containing protein n=1 Tax=Paraburkholderia sp. TaxID=1926495 RepID=UPI0023925E6C|nr:MEDS domain-containing protein [Paraburkholderia sp.]MDE1182287.1 MEDS domain-containing protein [Paraburkholderia sp.]